MTKRRIVFVDAKSKGVDFGGEVAAYSFLPHNHAHSPLYGAWKTVPEAVIGLARQGFPTKVILVGGEVIEVRRSDA